MRRAGFSSRRSIPGTSIACVAACAAVAGLAGTLGAAQGAGVPAGLPNCQTKGLVVWLDTQANGAAGSVFYTLELTNLSGHTCALRGYPGVSAIGLRGHQIGPAASRDTGRRTRTVKLRNNHTASTMVRILDAGNFPPSSCGPVTAAGLRVFPPNQATSKTVPFPFAAHSGAHSPATSAVLRVRNTWSGCSSTGILGVQAIR